MYGYIEKSNNLTYVVRILEIEEMFKERML